MTLSASASAYLTNARAAGLPPQATQSLTDPDRAALLGTKGDFEKALSTLPPEMQTAVDRQADQTYQARLAAYLKQSPGSTEQDYLAYGHPPLDFYRTSAACDVAIGGMEGSTDTMTRHALGGQPITGDVTQQSTYQALIDQAMAYKNGLMAAAQYTSAHPR